MVVRTWLLAQIEAEAQLSSTHPLMRSIDSDADPFEFGLLEFLPQVNLRQLAI
jgi:hypothetical protein